MTLQRWALAATLSTLAFAAQATDPSHLYLLNDASDQYGGPALTGEGGSFGTSVSGQVGYQFGVNQGLILSAAVPASVYTIDFVFAFDEVGGYRRLVDFKDLASDSGLYNLSAALNFYPVATGVVTFAAGELARVTITRDADGLFNGYVNGALQISFSDTSGLATFSGPSAVARFFHDDLTNGSEASAGFVDYIRTYDSALSAAEVGALTNPVPVPEPGTWALMAAGLYLLAARRARARR